MEQQDARFETFEYDAAYPVSVYPVYTDDLAESYLPHWHDELEICYIRKGLSEHRIDGKTFIGKPGDLIVTTPGSIHSITVKDTGEPQKGIRAIVVFLHRQFLEQIFPDYRSYYFTNENSTAPRAVEKLMLQLVRYRDRREQPFVNYLVAGDLLQLVYYIVQTGIRKTQEDFSEPKGVRINRIRDILIYIDQHYDSPLREDELANRFYVSKYYFSRFFKQYTGKTFTAYLKQLRLDKARQKLLSTDDSVLDICLQCGFTDLSRFTSAFKQAYGLTPLQYRKKNRDES